MLFKRYRKLEKKHNLCDTNDYTILFSNLPEQITLWKKEVIMVEHIVLLKLKSGVTEAQLETLSNALLGMADEIPGIESITAGTNNSPEGKSQGYAYGFIVRFTDEAARDAYLPHPFHRQVAGEHIRPLVEDVLVFDYSVLLK